jgi:hypothetical protein
MAQNNPTLPNLVQKDRKPIEVDQNDPKQSEMALEYLKLSKPLQAFSDGLRYFRLFQSVSDYFSPLQSVSCLFGPDRAILDYSGFFRDV